MTLSFDFNSRPSARGDASQCNRNHPQPYFNSRPSARGDPEILLALRLSNGHFNSRPSARGDLGDSAAMRIVYISIHAPPRGATSYFDTVPHKTTKFQFTPLREGRQKRNDLVARGLMISIHAPPRGATANFSRENIVNLLFQFTPLREGRPAGNSASWCESVFQFTPLREGRRTIIVKKGFIYPISIHAPPRGATAAA